MRVHRSSRIAKCISAIVMLALGISIGAGAAVMAHGGDGGLVHACVHKNSGNVRIVGAEEPCKKNEHALVWGTQGPSGPAGADGLNGADGEDGLDGEKGDPGLVWRGDWNADTEYAGADAVHYQGSSYVAIAPNANESPEDGSSWNVLALKGEQGPEGAQETPGPASENTDLEARIVDLETLVEDLANSLVTVPTLSIGNVEMAEGDSGTTAFTFPVSLSNSSLLTITVDYATVRSDAPYTARNGIDFILASGTLIFEPGETTKSITVEVVGESFPEQNEPFYVDLENPINTVILDSQGIGMVLNDDVLRFDVSDTADCEDGSTCSFRVMVVGHIDQPVTVDYTTVDGSAIAGTDYVAASGTLTFLPGQATNQNQYVWVPVSTIERPSATGMATFYVDLSNPVNADHDGDRVVVTINRD